MSTNTNYTKKIIFMILLLTSFCCLNAQATYDPSDSFYTDLQVWQDLGIVTKLPSLRPYPTAVVKQILNTVIDSDFEKQSEIAKNHYERLFGQSIHGKAEYQYNNKISNTNDTDNTKHVVKLGAIGNLDLSTHSNLGFDLSAYGTNNYYADCFKLYEYSSLNSAYDPVSLGKWNGFIDMNSLFSFGTENLYVTAGITRNSYGNFYDTSVVWGNQAYHSGNLNIVYRQNDLWQYEQTFFILGATNNEGSINIIKPEKYATIHTVTFNLLKWLSFSYFETIVYGGRFEPIYFIPAPYMVSQSIGAFSDNLQMGLSFAVKPFTGFVWNSEFFVDDISANELLKFDFDTKIKMAGQTGIEYAFADSFISKVSLGYTLVAPYMYTHREYVNGVLGTLSTINYQNYTNNGIPLGSSLEPNSDRILLKANFNPIKNLDIEIQGAFIRHANINESIPVQDAINYLNASTSAYLTDGSIFNYADAGYGYFTYAQENFMFMAQNTKMYIVQLGIDTSYGINLSKFGQIKFVLGYDFEYIKNYGVQNPIFAGGYTNATISDVEYEINQWKSKLVDKTNHCLSISVKYIY